MIRLYALLLCFFIMPVLADEHGDDHDSKSVLNDYIMQIRLNNWHYVGENDAKDDVRFLVYHDRILIYGSIHENDYKKRLLRDLKRKYGTKNKIHNYLEVRKKRISVLNKLKDQKLRDKVHDYLEAQDVSDVIYDVYRKRLYALGHTTFRNNEVIKAAPYRIKGLTGVNNLIKIEMMTEGF